MTVSTKKKNNKSECKIPDNREAKKFDYSPEEHAIIEKYFNSLKTKPVKYRAMDENRPLEVKGDQLLAAAKITESIGVCDPELQIFFLNQVVQAFENFQSSRGACEKSEMLKFFNNAMAILHGIKPQDVIEGMLAVQMIGVHNMAMEAMRLVMISDQHPESKDRNTNRATKLLRTFAAQMETLKRYRTGGQQKMTVEHVHVHQGGQAIVGSVSQGGGCDDK